ncbi:MAG: biotin--[acetyl-CoA-carboxylase] ligase [Planctomyces sp.]|nr:biotin--[acetyl-CoA-carboxylase] ligase [Planctomyces sp.]
MDVELESALDALTAAGRIAGWEHHRALASTNDHALERIPALAAEDLPHLVISDAQTAGRGRGANRWWSAPGALLFTLIVDPEAWRIDQRLWPRLSVAVGGAVVEAVAALGAGSAAQLKWPNDVYIGGRKVCGILVEGGAGTTARVAIGVGVNVTNSFEDAPEEVRARAASLSDCGMGAVDRAGTLVAILDHLARDLELLTDEPAGLVDRWRGRCFLTGRMISVESAGQIRIGACLGLEDDASLLLQTDVGLERCYAGVVTVLDAA